MIDAYDYLDPVAVADAAGAPLERYGYDTFGVQRVLTPDFSNRSRSNCDWNFLFHGEFLDQDTLFYDYGYRHYFPQLGRWLSRDPVGELFFRRTRMIDLSLGLAKHFRNPATVGVNLYFYLVNNPIIRRDLLGLCTPGAFNIHVPTLTLMDGTGDIIKSSDLKDIAKDLGEDFLKEVAKDVSVIAGDIIESLDSTFIVAMKHIAKSSLGDVFQMEISVDYQCCCPDGTWAAVQNETDFVYHTCGVDRAQGDADVLYSPSQISQFASDFGSMASGIYTDIKNACNRLKSQ